MNDLTLRARNGMVCTADHRASDAGLAVLRAGGNAVDAAIAANAVLAVTSPHLCGLGGDLYALVHEPGGAAPATLNATGRAGSGADPERLRREGFRTMPFVGDVRVVTIPGCVDGWIALHGAHGTRPLDELLAPATAYAVDGFAVAPLLAAMLPALAGVAGNEDFFGSGSAASEGQVVTRPGVARALTAIGRDGRAGFYEGEFGRGLVAMSAGLFTAADLARDNAEWTAPVSVSAWGHTLWTPPPNSQGYLALLGAAIAAGLELGHDPDDPAAVHLLIEAAIAAGHDRPDVLFDGADVEAVLSDESVRSRRAPIDPRHRANLGSPTAAGGTTYLCTADADGRAVSLIQSNAAQFGARVFEPSTRINLQNRGLGFTLEPGHPAELGPGRRPPHTLSPLIVTRADGTLRQVVGTRGGDSQPQLVLQLLARTLAFGQPVGPAMAAPRWEIAARESNSFNAWTPPQDLVVQLERDAPESWAAGLAERGHLTRVPGNAFGHAQLIDATDDGDLVGASDPRALIGSAAGF